MTDEHSAAPTHIKLGRSPYRVEAGVLAELQRAWLAGALTDTRTPVDERKRKGLEYAAEVREELLDLLARESAEVEARRDELVGHLRDELNRQRETDDAGFTHWMAAALHLPDEDHARQALAIALKTDARLAAATVAMRAHFEGWDTVFTEWCGRCGWPQEDAA